MIMKKGLSAILFFFLSLSVFEARASHIVGGEYTYVYLGDTSIGGTLCHKYKVSLSIYEDCQNGQPEAILEDNPAYLAAYKNAPPYNTINIDSVPYATSVVVPANFSNSCVTNIPPTCLLKKTFVKTYYFPVNTAGYVISYQRCCRNNAVVNIVDPGDNGSTYYCTIPGSPYNNNSAVFTNYPPQIICLNNPLYYDHSATDPDGDSLSYEFCSALIGASDADIKPIPLPPPYDSVSYLNPPFSYQHPLTAYPALQIDPKTGLITGTPNRIGRYLVTVCCHEWRHGVMVNTIKREFQFVVTDCSKVVVADIPQYSSDFNTYIVDCADYTVHFVNNSTGGFSWDWNFGTPGGTSTDFEPTFIYPDTGTYTVKLVVNPSSTCPDSISRFVKIYPRFNASFSDSGQQCPGAPINFTDLSSATIKPVNYWKWYFGDGDSVFQQNPLHTYAHGGTYNIILISQNIKNCVDTAIRKLIIEGFQPFAGNDTIIVKGEKILFNAMGGTSYTWSPGTNLSDTNIFDPVGYYPDTGRYAYNVHVVSDYGCAGDDSIKVLVVNQAAFFVPSAFTPNGDGMNDVFRPIAIGYRSLKYFRVYNRFGEMVFDTNTLEAGWDGTYMHKLCDVGVYFWQVSFTDRYGNEGFMKGDVTLLR
jgi:gliding motility-associated-like protein